jgi:hypothetical protein
MIDMILVIIAVAVFAFNLGEMKVYAEWIRHTEENAPEEYAEPTKPLPKRPKLRLLK